MYVIFLQNCFFLTSNADIKLHFSIRTISMTILFWWKISHWEYIFSNDHSVFYCVKFKQTSMSFLNSRSFFLLKTCKELYCLLYFLKGRNWTVKAWERGGSWVVWYCYCILLGYLWIYSHVLRKLSLAGLIKTFYI